MSDNTITKEELIRVLKNAGSQDAERAAEEVFTAATIYRLIDKLNVSQMSWA